MEGMVLNGVQEKKEYEEKLFNYLPRKRKPSFCLFLS